MIFKTLNDILQLQNDLKLLEHWAGERGMKWNATKCYVISTESAGTPFFYTLNDHILKYVSRNSYLGVTLAEDLIFDADVGSRMLGFLQKTLKSSPSSLLLIERLRLDSLQERHKTARLCMPPHGDKRRGMPFN